MPRTSFVSAAIATWLLTVPLLSEATAMPVASWQSAVAPWTWSFPRDHGAHPAFRTEWWYFTGNVQDKNHRRFGYQLTFFRQGLQFAPAQTRSLWAARDFYFGHFTITDLATGKFHVEERVSRGALGEAHAGLGRMDVKLGDWTLLQAGGTEQFQLAATGNEMGLRLEEHPAKPLILEGVDGLSRKAEGVGNASYYYSYPRLATQGRLSIGDTAYDVSGESWFDHEFSTSSLGPKQVGWDWFCVQLNNHEEIMIYVMRDSSGTMEAVSEGTWVRADGRSERLVPGSFRLEKTGTWKSPSSGAIYPSGWHLELPTHQVDLTISPAQADQELRLTRMGALNYWEGSCEIQGNVAGKPVSGVGYTELTGYAGSLQPSFQE